MLAIGLRSVPELPEHLTLRARACNHMELWKRDGLKTAWSENKHAL